MIRASLPILASMILASAFAMQGNAEDKSALTNSDGDRSLVTQLTDDETDIFKFDVTVFKSPSDGNHNPLKRLTGRPGETLVRQDGQPHVVREVIETIKTQDATIKIMGETIRIRGGNVEIRRTVPPLDRKDSEVFTFIAFDSFDGKARLNWQPVRHNPSHVSFTKNPGKLTITTQRGTIHGDEKNDAYSEGTQANNIFLIDNPLAPETDFVLTTCVTGFTPAIKYQQAGLIIYNDDDNYLKWGYEFNWRNRGGQAFCILSETDAESDFTYVDSPSGLDKYWVRLTKRGNRYEYAFSTDGKDFTVRGERQWGDGVPRKMGLLAKNGGNKEAGELDAKFEFFELRSPVPADIKRKQ